MNEMIVNALLTSAVYPLLIGLVIGYLAQRRSDGPLRWFGMALAVVVGFVLCFRGTAGLNIPPHSALDWLPYLALAALLVQFAAVRLPDAAQIALPVLLIDGFLWILLQPIARNHGWDTQKTLMVLVAITLPWTFFYLAHTRYAKVGDTPVRLLLLVFAATGFSITALLCESAKLAQITGGLAAVIGGLFLVWCIARTLELGPMVPGVFVVTLGGLMVYGYFYVEIPLYAIGLVVLSCLSHWLLRVPFIANLGPWPRTVLVVLIALLPIGAAIYCVETFRPKEEYYEY